jgi:hypothetical protein
MTAPRAAPRPKRLTIVLARWCPHCVPLSLRYGRRFAARLGVPLRVLDIDRRREVRVADRLVREHGDASPDYLIPQVFVEWSDGTVEPVLTGFSEQGSRTERAWNDLLRSDWLAAVRSGRRP